MEVGIILLALYFLPTIVALANSHHNAVAIFALNLFLGWTLIGWVLSLVWALAKPPPQTVVIQQDQPLAVAPPPAAPARNPGVPVPMSSKQTAWIVTAVVIAGVLLVGAGMIAKTKRAPLASTNVLEVSGDTRDTPAPIDPSALAPYTKIGFPTTFATWGESGVARIEALRKVAAERAARHKGCDAVEVVEWSGSRSTPPAEVVIWVDCRNKARLYYREMELR